jgi:preprotein translocase subunit SecD
MRRTLPSVLLSVLVLAGCQASAPGTYLLTYDSAVPARVTELSAASARVVLRRLLGMNQKVTAKDVTLSPDQKHLTVQIKDKQVKNDLTAQLVAPFTMSVMVETADATDPKVLLNKYGAFTPTELTETYFDSVVAGESQTAKGKGAIVIRFTKEGTQKLHEVFQKNQGKTMGVFVRGNLMSKKVIDPTDTQDSILVDGVPSAELAKVFADDVNVGLHVKFKPE